MAKDIFEDVRIRGEADLYLEDNLIQNGKQVTGRPYKIYTARLVQTGLAPIVATVFENTLGGTVVWSAADGENWGTLTGAFPIDKTIIFLSTVTGAPLSPIVFGDPQAASPNEIYIYDGTTEGLNVPLFIEVRVYP